MLFAQSKAYLNAKSSVETVQFFLWKIIYFIEYSYYTILINISYLLCYCITH